MEFELSAGTIDASEDTLYLNANFAVSAGGGSVTLTMSNPSLQGETTSTHGPANVVKMAAALDEKAVALNPVADVAADGYMQFLEMGANTNVATVGSLQVTVKAMHRLVSDGSVADALDDIMTVGTGGTPAVPNSTVTFMGDFSFASSVFLHGENDCDPTTGTDTDAIVDIRIIEGTGDDAVVTGTTEAVNVEDLDDAPEFLCIMVDPTADNAMRIPSTGAYTAMGSYMKRPDAAIGPMPMEQTLGRIERNGATYRLPYLTVNDKFSQRLRIVNRGGEDVRYTIEFHGDGDSPDEVEGMAAKETVTVMLVGGGNALVTPGSGQSTSGTLMVESEPEYIDVATVQTNRATGASDTVVYTEDPLTP